MRLPGYAAHFIVAMAWVPMLQRVFGHPIMEIFLTDVGAAFGGTFALTGVVAVACALIWMAARTHSRCRGGFLENNRYRFEYQMSQSVVPYQYQYSWQYFSDEEPDAASEYFLTRDVASNEYYPEDWTLADPREFVNKNDHKVYRKTQRVHAHDGKEKPV